MLLFAHLGITTGIVKICDIVAGTAEPIGTEESDAANLKRLCLCSAHRIRGLLSAIDYRMVLLGSMLPDILDKPTWLFAFGDIFPTGRGYAHSFLFNLILLVCALVLFRHGKSWLLAISLSSFAHLLLDQMWNGPTVLWWPLRGPLPQVETAGWLSHIMQGLSTDPSVYIPEVVGLVILLSLSSRVVVMKDVMNFIRTGVIR